MGSKLIDRATKARNRKAPAEDAKASDVEAPNPPAPDAEFEAEVAEAIAEGVEPVAAEAEANAIEDDDEAEADVVDFADAVIARMSEEEIEAFLASRNLSTTPGVAEVRASRTTKRNQVQYDGQTPEGFVVRIWAPEGAAMVMRAQLHTAE